MITPEKRTVQLGGAFEDTAFELGFENGKFSIRFRVSTFHFVMK
jgi:hypothetical protein